MSRGKHFALIHFRFEVVEGIIAAKETLKKVSLWGTILGVSSVYKRYMTKEATDLSAYLEFVIRIETTLNVEETLANLMSYCASGGMGIVQSPFAELTLLVFDDLVQMSPKLTLPYPRLHEDPLIIRSASEAWGQYEHPIYQRNLSDLSRLAPPVGEIEFYIQGKTLVDF